MSLAMTPYTHTHSLAYRAVVAFWLACLLYSVFGRLVAAATIVGEANVQHQGCVTVYAPDRSYRLQQADCIFGNGF